MIVANTADGATRQFDCTFTEQVDALDALISAGKVTALALAHKGATCVLPKPQGRPRWGAQALTDRTGSVTLAERVFLITGATKVSLTRTLSSGLVRCDVTHVGVARYTPTKSWA